MNQRPDILIIGGGAVGLTTAWYLAGQGVSVSVVDRQQVGREASWAGAGMLPPGKLQHAFTPEARLRSYSHQLWDTLTSELKNRTGIDNGYRLTGSVEIRPVHPVERDGFARQLSDWRAEGIIVEDLDRLGLEKHVPSLADDLSFGVFLPEFGQVRNPRHVKALAAACRQVGVDIIEDQEQISLTVHGRQVQAATPDRQFLCDRICVCAGSWSSRVLEPLGVALPVKPVRGQMAQLRVGQLPFSCVIEQGRRYIVPRADGLILVGSTEEHVGFEKRNTTEGVADLLKFAESLVPELGRAEMIRCWAGLRPGSPDELPFLGRVPQFNNLFLAAGHFRSGLQMSPGTGAVLTDLLLDRTPGIDLGGLTFDRIETMTA